MASSESESPNEVLHTLSLMLFLELEEKLYASRFFS